MAADLDREDDGFELPPSTSNMLHGGIASLDCRVPDESVLPIRGQGALISDHIRVPFEAEDCDAF